MVSTLGIKPTLEDALGKTPWHIWGARLNRVFDPLLISPRRIKTMIGILLANRAHLTLDQYHARFLPNLP
jgi:hypothetical protein